MPTISPREVIQVGPVAVRFYMDATQTDGQFTMFDFRVPANARVPVPHSHVAFDEMIYGLNGVMTWTVGGETVPVEPGQVLFIRRGVIHGFENRGSEEATALSVITPGLLGPTYFQDVADVLNAGGPPDVARIMAVMQKHGLKPAPPR
jgi:quercetin dioxygenase-like cupin family protein